jgi:hypothetical protein
MYFINFKPFKEKFKNNLEMVNEVLIHIIMLMQFCFTDWIPENETKSNIGLIKLLIIGLNFFFSMTMISSKYSYLIVLWIKRLYNRHLEPLFEKLSSYSLETRNIGPFLEREPVEERPPTVTELVRRTEEIPDWQKKLELGEVAQANQVKEVEAQ